MHVRGGIEWKRRLRPSKEAVKKINFVLFRPASIMSSPDTARPVLCRQTEVPSTGQIDLELPKLACLGLLLEQDIQLHECQTHRFWQAEPAPYET